MMRLVVQGRIQVNSCKDWEHLPPLWDIISYTPVYICIYIYTYACIQVCKGPISDVEKRIRKQTTELGTVSFLNWIVRSTIISNNYIFIYRERERKLSTMYLQI